MQMRTAHGMTDRPLAQEFSRLDRLGRNVAASLIAVKGHLDTPYPDDPRWTPWTRFIERELQRLGESKDDIATVRSELERLREERDDAWRVNESLRNRLRLDPDGSARWRREAETYMREFGEQRARAEAAEAESHKNFDWAKAERSGRKKERTRADNAEARVRQLEDGLRDLLDAFPMDNPYGSMWKEYREAQEKARALLADSPDCPGYPIGSDGTGCDCGKTSPPGGGGAK